MTDNASTYTPPQFSLWSVFILLFRTLTGAHAMTIYLVLLLREVIGESNNLIMFFNETIHLGVLPSVGLLPLCLVLRRWGLALLLLPILVLAGLWYGPPLLRVEAAPPPADAVTLSVMTYNIAGLNSSGRDWGPVVDAILAADADVVALQELSPSAEAAISAVLMDTHPHQALYPANAAAGSGVYSRYPIVDEARWDGMFINQRVVLAVADEVVVLYNVHPPPPIGAQGFDFEQRNTEIAAIMARVAIEDPLMPLLLLGDFNTTDQSGAYATIRTHVNDAWAAVGRGLGFTFAPRRLWPAFRIDYVFYTAPLRPFTATVPLAGNSDHYPVVAAFAFTARLADESAP